MAEESSKEVIKSKHKLEKKDLLSSMRSNPWIVATVVLAVVLILVLVIQPGAGASVSSQEAGDKLLTYLNGQVDGGGVTLSDISQEKGLYKVDVMYQGTAYPFYVTLDGSSFISSLTPFDGSTTATATAGPVVIDESKLVGAPVKGQADAPVTIIEFSDFQCPFCRKFWDEAYTSIVSTYVDTGKAKIVYLDFPLSFHPQAHIAAVAARCARKVAGNDAAFWKMHDKIFSEQMILDGGTVKSTVTFDEADLKKWARDIGYNIDSCISTTEFDDSIAADEAYGQSIGISGTPGFFVNGIMLSGAQPFSAFKQVIDAELAKA